MNCSCGCEQPIPPKQAFRYRSPAYLAGHIERIPCACNCGGVIEWPHNTRAARPRVIAGHQSEARRQAYAARQKVERPSVSGPSLCACGCGELAPIATKTDMAAGTIKGTPRRFINGHNSVGMKRGPGRYIHAASGYVYLRKSDHPDAAKYDGYVLEHRWVMEQQLGRRLREDEHVHHINHVRSDNRAENLMVVDPIAHQQYHGGLPRRTQSEEHRRKTSEAMRQVWARRKAQQQQQ